MQLTLLLAALLTAHAEVPPVAGTPTRGKVVKHIDHSNQFSTPRRDQGKTGMCHAFTAVGLLEAWYHRKTKEHISLSDSDLFLQRTLLNPQAYYDYLKDGAAALTERAYTVDDIDHALNHGVATGLEFKDFMDRYERYRNAEAKTIAGIEKQRAAMSEEELKLYDPRSDWVDLQMQDRSKRILENYLTRNRRGRLDAERAATKKLFAGAKKTTLTFDIFDEFSGWAQTAAVKDALDGGQPVGIGDIGHAFIITGYRVYEDGSLVYETRDSAYREKDLAESHMAEVQIIYLIE